MYTIMNLFPLETEDNTLLDEEKKKFNIPPSDRLSYDKLTFYYISLPIILFGNLFGALLLSAMQINIVDIYPISIWLLVSFIMFLYQLYHYFKFQNESQENKLRDANIWLDKYYTNIFINGIIWGSSAFLMFPENNLMNQMLVILFLFSIGFSGMGVLASKKDLLLTYVLVTYTPLLLRLFFMEDELYVKIAYAILALILIMIFVADYYGKIINKSLNDHQHFITIQHSHKKLKERFLSLFERAPVGMYYYNKSLELEDVNSHFMKMNKVTNKEMLIKQNLYTLENYRQILTAHEDVFKGKTGSYRGPFEIASKDENIYVTLSTVPIQDTGGHILGGVTIINDITNEVTAKQKMVRNAYYDMLTNIPNRTLFMDKLTSFIAEGKTHHKYSSLLFLDIDNFKKVNETYGYDAGDHLLKQIVNRIDNIIDNRDFFARISANKFVILISSLDTNKEKSEHMTNEYIQILRNNFSHPLNIAGEEYRLSFTVGIVLFTCNNASAYDILKHAETALYAAKKNARGLHLFYTENMHSTSKEELMIENDIHKAIKNNELSLHYQPQLDIKTHKIIGAEILVRWKHPSKGYIPPAQFLPIAEESGSIIKLEEWIFEKAFQEIKVLSMQKNGFTLKHIAINISTIHFLQAHFVEKFMLLVQKYKIKPEWINLELTENALMRNIEDVVEKINELKTFGFSFSIDDFGIGYSSLSYLKKLPIDIIKIDQSFIINMHQDSGDATIVETIIAIGQKFNLTVLAKGVENSDVVKHLTYMECDYYQGHYSHKPMHFDDFLTLIT